VIGLSTMIGVGVFAAFVPAAAAAGTGLLIGLLVAGVVAYCNAISSAVLAAKYPQSVRPLVEPLERAADNLLRMAKAVAAVVSIQLTPSSRTRWMAPIDSSSVITASHRLRFRLTPFGTDLSGAGTPKRFSALPFEGFLLASVRADWPP